MKIGCIIIHSESYTERKQYVSNLQSFFKEIEVIVVPGVITETVLYDARTHNECNSRYNECNLLTKGQTGCALAHMNALKIAIEHQFDYVYILEDDVEINVNDYKSLQSWLDKLNDYDICLITNVGSYEGVGHDKRIHKNTITGELKYMTCPFGTQAYYCNRSIVNLLYNTQKKAIEENKIHIADGLHIHCEKDQGVYLKLVSPKNENLFFKHSNTKSIIKELR